MTQRVKIPIVGGSYKHESLPFDSQETINLFTERGGKGSKSPGILRRFPGLKPWVTVSVGSGPINSLYETSNQRLFAVRYNKLLEYTSIGTETIIGNIGRVSGRTYMTDNGTQLGIPDGKSIWVYDFSAGTLTAVSDPDAPDVTPTLEFIDGYVFGFDPDDTVIGRFYHSDLNDMTSWNPLDVYKAEGSPDRLVMIKALNRQLWLFGSKSFEVWYNQGGDNVTSATWARILGTFKNIGCSAPKSVEVIGGQIFWLGGSKEGENIVWTAGSNYQPVQISNSAMEGQISKYSNVNDATAITYKYKGHFFYELTFQGGNKTFVYDISQGEWINRAYRDPSTGEQGRNRAFTHAYFSRKNLVGDYLNGNIYELDSETYTDNGDQMVWERKFSYVHANNLRISIYSLFIDILTGTGLLAGQGSDPKIQLRVSRNGGRTYGNWHTMDIGERGDYNFQLVKRLLGQSRSWGFHIRSSEPIPMSIQDNCWAEVEISDS